MHVKWNTNQRILHKVPESAPPVFAGDRILFYALLDETMPFDHTTTVELFTSTQQQPIGTAHIDHVPAVLEKQTIMRLAGKALLRELMNAQKSADKEFLINLSIKYGILCPHTAFIGVEKRLNATSESNANMELREVPIMIDKSSAKSPIQSYHNLLQVTNYCVPTSGYSLQSLHCDVQDTLCVMQSSISKVLERGDRLDELQYRAESLNTSTPHFKACAKRSIGFSGGFGSITQPITGFFSSLLTKKRTSSYSASGESSSVQPSVSKNTDQSSSNSNTSNNQTKKVNWSNDQQKLVDHFVDLQKYDGLWVLTADDVTQLTSKPLTAFSSSVVKNMDKTQQEAMITTAIVIAILESRCSSLKTLWQALSNKAQTRLKELLGGDETQLKQLLKDIHDQL